MNDQQRAAMTMALDLLIDGAEPAATQKKADDGMCAQWDVDAWEAITALREALAQHEFNSFVESQQIDLTQGEWVDLTDDEIMDTFWFAEDEDLLNSIRTVIAKFKEKNTPPSVEAAIEATKEKAAKLVEELLKQNAAASFFGRGEIIEPAAAIRSMK